MYNAATDEKNQNKKVATPTESKSEELKTKRRHQTLDTEAPVSNRQTRKRKAHIESQVSIAEQVRDLQHAPVVNI